VEALSDERMQLEKQWYVYEQHIAGNKRQNLIKKACLAIVNGINPYIDRILNEVHKLTERGYIDNAKIKKEKYQYIDELVTTINEYNDILALWIKMKQGTLSLNIETFSLNELFELLGKGRRAFEMKNQKLEIEPTTVMVKADRALTLFMINTLAENARKYTPEGGTIKVYARTTEDAYVEISVEDNGRGISEEDVAHIIGEKVYDSRVIGMKNAADPEVLKENKGSGFGLMNCKGIIEKYKKTNDLFRGCVFDVESELGQGSCFEVLMDLKIAEDRTASLAAQEETDEQDGNILLGMRFLCAEDNELNAEILMELLKIEGAECTICENGKRVLETFEQSVPGDYDMILMDVQMPVMNGYEATKAIRRSSHELAKTIPIIAMTANAFSEDIQHSLAAGMNAHISKPVDMKTLEKTIRSIKSGGGGGVPKRRSLLSNH